MCSGTSQRVLCPYADWRVYLPNRLAVVEGRAGFRRAFGKQGVQPATLGHVGQGLAVAAVEAGPQAQAEPRAVDGALDDGRKVEALRGSGAQRNAATAGLVPREAVLIEQQYVGAALGQQPRRRAARGPRAGDDDIVITHGLSVRGGGTDGQTASSEQTDRRGKRPDRPTGRGCSGSRRREACLAPTAQLRTIRRQSAAQHRVTATKEG